MYKYLSIGCFITGGISALLSGLLHYRLYEKTIPPLKHANLVYLTNTPANITELNSKMKSGEVIYPAIIQGKANCWAADGEKLHNNLSGDPCCFQRFYVDGRLVRNASHKLYIQDKDNDKAGIEVSLDDVKWTESEPYYHNMLASTMNGDSGGRRLTEIFVRPGDEIFAVGKLEKQGDKITIKAHSNVPDSFLVSFSTPQAVLEPFSEAIAATEAFESLLFRASIVFLGLGLGATYMHRKRTKAQ